MQKFRLLVEFLRHKGIVNSSNLIRPGKARSDVLGLAHSAAYLERFISGALSPKEIRRLGLPWSNELVTRTLISPNGTLLTAQLALKYGVACHLAGGTHHAHYDFASGYCILNDLAVASKTILAQGKAKRILIFDCDVHQGDGTAAILNNEPSITTCSIHCEKNFPARKQRSDIDVGVAEGLSDTAYLMVVKKTLDKAISESDPDLILYDAGVDVYEYDPLGLLNISLSGLRARESLVLETALSQGIPIATVIGGGYDHDQSALATRHAIVVEEAHRCWLEFAT